MKKILFVSLIFLMSNSYAQGFSGDKVSLINFIKRMYTAKAFEGVKIVDEYDQKYLISIVALDKSKYTNSSIMNRIATVKAQSQASSFLNGSTITTDFLLTTKENKDSLGKVNSSVIETIEQIKQNSTGFSQGLELLTNFDSQDMARMIFIFGRELTNK